MIVGPDRLGREEELVASKVKHLPHCQSYLVHTSVTNVLVLPHCVSHSCYDTGIAMEAAAGMQLEN